MPRGKNPKDSGKRPEAVGALQVQRDRPGTATGAGPLRRNPATVDDQQRATSERHGMKRKEQLTLCGRYGLVVAAFALITGIVAAPLLPRVWPPAAVVAHR
jgi:hypothetical protein